MRSQATPIVTLVETCRQAGTRVVGAGSASSGAGRRTPARLSLPSRGAVPTGQSRRAGASRLALCGAPANLAEERGAFPQATAGKLRCERWSGVSVRPESRDGGRRSAAAGTGQLHADTPAAQHAGVSTGLRRASGCGNCAAMAGEESHRGGGAAGGDTAQMSAESPISRGRWRGMEVDNPRLRRYSEGVTIHEKSRRRLNAGPPPDQAEDGEPSDQNGEAAGCAGDRSPGEIEVGAAGGRVWGDTGEVSAERLDRVGADGALHSPVEVEAPAPKKWWQRVVEAGASIPEEDRARIPRDAAENLDYYLQLRKQARGFRPALVQLPRAASRSRRRRRTAAQPG